MKYVTQMLYILLFSGLGELLEHAIPLPIPAAIYGLVLLLIALSTGLLKEEKVADTADFLISVMPLLISMVLMSLTNMDQGVTSPA